jgi:hypothetical protein
MEHRLAQLFCWAAPVMVWQRSTQAARMAVQSTAMAGAVASSTRQAAMRTTFVVAFIPVPPREVRSRPTSQHNKFWPYGIIAMRRFPPPWTIERLPGGFKVIDVNGQSLAYNSARNDGDGFPLITCSRQEEPKRPLPPVRGFFIRM